jgi:hypothetical protein
VCSSFDLYYGLYLLCLSVTMAHGQRSFLSVQISPALVLFAECAVDKAKHLHLRLMQSDLATQEVANLRLTVLGRLDFLCCFYFGSLLFQDLVVVQFSTMFIPGITRTSWVVFAKDCLPGICIIL